MKNLLLFFVLSFVFKMAIAQQSGVTLIADKDLDSLILINIEKNKAINSLDGYRIQIFSGNNRNNAEELKTDFFKKNPGVPAYLIYQQPYFKLRVGDFRNKFEAQALYQKLIDEYGQAILVPDKINFPKVN